MRRIHSFTLVEILVVIAIIGILAGLVFPALNRARAVSQATTCLNNKRSLAQVANSYATDHNREIIFSFGGGNDAKPYSLLFRGYTLSAYDTDDRPTGRVYMSFPAMRCPLAKIRTDKGKEIDPEQQVSAMFDVDRWLGSNINGKKGEERYGKFRIDNRGDGVVYYSFRQMRSTSTLPLFADAFDSSSGDKLFGATWKFDESGAGGRITLLHQDKATVSYADGHADAQDKGGLEAMGLSGFQNEAFKKLN